MELCSFSPPHSVSSAEDDNARHATVASPSMIQGPAAFSGSETGRRAMSRSHAGIRQTGRNPGNRGSRVGRSFGHRCGGRRALVIGKVRVRVHGEELGF